MKAENRPPVGSFKIFILTVVLVGICLGLNFLLVKGVSTLQGIGTFLVVDNGDSQPVDLIHILGGQMERLDYGIELYEAGISPRLFITGGIDDVLKYREYALDRGVHAEDIFPKESQALTTYEEALALKQFLDQEQAIHSVMVVSSPYHMRRSQLIFEWLLGNRVKLQFRPVPFERSGHQRRWWADPGSRQSVIG